MAPIVANAASPESPGRSLNQSQGSRLLGSQILKLIPAGSRRKSDGSVTLALSTAVGIYAYVFIVAPVSTRRYPAEGYPRTYRLPQGPAVVVQKSAARLGRGPWAATASTAPTVAWLMLMPRLSNSARLFGSAPLTCGALIGNRGRLLASRFARFGWIVAIEFAHVRNCYARSAQPFKIPDDQIIDRSISV